MQIQYITAILQVSVFILSNTLWLRNRVIFSIATFFGLTRCTHMFCSNSPHSISVSRYNLYFRRHIFSFFSLCWWNLNLGSDLFSLLYFFLNNMMVYDIQFHIESQFRVCAWFLQQILTFLYKMCFSDPRGKRVETLSI
jgi:hypothetical protein